MSLIDETCAAIAPIDHQARTHARARLEQLTMPPWALGRLMDLAEDLAGMTGSPRPSMERRAIVLMAGDHGVACEGVSAYPQAVTGQMLANFVAGGAGINVLARQAGCDVRLVDMGVAAELGTLHQTGRVLDRRIAAGTANLAAGPAMEPAQARRALEHGIDVGTALCRDYDLIGLGEMGIANTTAATAILCAVSGHAPRRVAGRGTLIDDATLERKIEVLERALAVNRPRPDDGLDILAKLGGFEIGGLAGVILAAARHRRPVLLDGFITGAAALIAQLLCPRSMDYCIAAHRSAEQAHALMLEQLGKTPLLVELGLRLGEGTGAALASNLVVAAAGILSDVATFEEAAVTGAVGERVGDR